MAYQGNERRIHKIFVTRNTEYHIREDQCVGVRDRRTGEWLKAHLALSSRMSGSLRFSRDGGVLPNLEKPKVGESLFFQASGRDLVTSAVLSVQRPPADVVQSYAQ